MDTTRRYPRTLGDAFRGVAYACAIERPGTRPDRIVLRACGIAAIGLLLILLLERA